MFEPVDPHVPNVQSSVPTMYRAVPINSSLLELPQSGYWRFELSGESETPRQWGRKGIERFTALIYEGMAQG